MSWVLRGLFAGSPWSLGPLISKIPDTQGHRVQPLVQGSTLYLSGSHCLPTWTLHAHCPRPLVALCLSKALLRGLVPSWGCVCCLTLDGDLNQHKGLNRYLTEAGVGTAVHPWEDAAEVGCEWTGHRGLLGAFYLFQKCRVHRPHKNKGKQTQWRPQKWLPQIH